MWRRIETARADANLNFLIASDDCNLSRLADTGFPNDHDPPWLLPRVIFRGRFQEYAFNTPLPRSGKSYLRFLQKYFQANRSQIEVKSPLPCN